MWKRLALLFIIMPAIIFFTMWHFLAGKLWAGVLVVMGVAVFLAAPWLQILARLTR